MSAPDSLDTTLETPLLFQRIFLDKVWGGRALEESLGIELGIDGPVGETWELVDREDHNSVALEGPCEGRHLRGMMLTESEALLGSAKPTKDGAFPLLVKYLDASQPLSVQVHPNHRVAKHLGVESGKTECWYILSAEPKSIIYLGLREGVDAATFAEKASSPEVVDLLTPWTVKAGQFVFVPAGTVHAVGSGITLAEIQENCDVTFRLYDWGRLGLDGKPRPAHIEEALLAIQYDQVVEGPITPELIAEDEVNQRAELVRCEAFQVELLNIGGRVEHDTENKPTIYIVIKGQGQLARQAEEWTLSQGDVWLLPAAVGAHSLELDGESLQVLRVRTEV